MNVVLFDNEVSKGHLKNYADAVCFSQVGLGADEIAYRLAVPEHIVSAWIVNWRCLDAAMSSAQ